MLPTGDLARNPGMCPDCELNWRPCGLQLTLNPLSYTTQDGSQHSWSQNMALERNWNPGVPATLPRSRSYSLGWFPKKLLVFRVGRWMAGTLMAQPKGAAQTEFLSLDQWSLLALHGGKPKPGPPFSPLPTSHQRYPLPSHHPPVFTFTSDTLSENMN